MIRFMVQDRPHLIPSLRYADVTPFVSENGFPKLGDPRLVEFWLHATNYNNTIAAHLYKPTNKDVLPVHYLFVSGSGRYFITAMPNAMRHTGLNVFTFENEWLRDVAMVALNSNVFYWLWCVLGDGFHVTGDNATTMVLPKVPIGDEETKRLRDTLLRVAEECATYQIKWAEKIPNYNFNRRMDVLLEIDAWVIKHVAPGLALPDDIFAQYKSNSFLRPLNLSALTLASGEEIDE